VQPTHDEGSEWDGDGEGQDINAKGPYGVQWTYLYDEYGIVRINTVSSSTFASATVVRRLADTLTGIPSWKWTMGAFNDTDGHPGISFLWAGRLCWIRGNDLFASVAGDYLNHKRQTSSGLITADLAFWRRLDLPNPPLWAKVDREVVILGTVSGEHIVRKINPAEALSGSNIEVVKQTNYGSQDVLPTEVGPKTIFVQRGGRKLQEADYGINSDRYDAINLTVWARHVTKSGIVQLAFQQEPELILWAVRGDGTLVARPMDPEQEIKGFARVPLGGSGVALSAVAIPGEDGETDELWLLVSRSGALTVEKMMPWWDEDAGMAQEDQFFVDSGATYDGSATTTISGLDHLSGEDVAVLADGAVVAGLDADGNLYPEAITVSGGGAITLPAAASKVHAGYSYLARFVSLPLSVQSRKGELGQGIYKRLRKLLVRVVDSGMLWGGTKNGTLEQLFRRDSGDAMDAGVPLYSGQSEDVSAGNGNDRLGQYELVSRDPTHACIVLAKPEFEVENER
jgi:hypothetical protein